MADLLFFYSWQSDSPNRTNRGFIKDALDKSSRLVTAKSHVEEAVRVTSDTQGASGAPDISQTIFDTIDASDGFVADVTLALRSTDSERMSPNPNVLLELGYAAHALGWDRIVMVANVAFGPLENLPFDLRGRRIINYSFPDKVGTEPARFKEGVVRRLEDAVSDIVGMGRRYRGPSGALKQYWLSELQVVRDLTREAMVRARNISPPLYKRSNFGMAQRHDEASLLSHLTIRDADLRALSRSFVERCESFAQKYFAVGKAMGNDDFDGPTSAQVSKRFTTHEGVGELERLEAAYEAVLERAEKLLE